MLGVDEGIEVEDDGPFDDVAEFADVARPSVFAKFLARSIGESFTGLVIFGTKAVEKVMSEGKDVFDSLAQRGDVERDDIEAVEEIFTENFRFNGFLHVPVGSGEKADIHLDRAGTADPFKFLFLDGAEEFRLEHEGDFSHFVEEKSSLIGKLEAASFSLESAGEGSFFVPEKF